MLNQSFIIPLATVFTVWLCVFTTFGNASSLHDDNEYTQSALTATNSYPDPGNIRGFPISIGGGGNSNGGDGWLRIWTPFGWIIIRGDGDRQGGGGAGGFIPFFPLPSPPKSNVPPPSPSNPITPNPPSPLEPTPKHPSNPVTPDPPSPFNPVKPDPPSPSNPTPEHPPSPNPLIPTPRHPSNPVTPNPFIPTPQTPPSRPPLPPWLAPFFGDGGKHPSPPSPLYPHIPPWLAPYIGHDGRLHMPPPPPLQTPKWLLQYIGSDGRLHLPDQPSRPIPKWLAPYIRKPPHSSLPADLKTESETSGLKSSKTSSEGIHHYYQCWSRLEKVDKCVNEILTAFSSRKFQVLGSACCSAIQKMDKDCHARTIGNFHDHFFSASVHKHCSAN